jgi:RNA polymerase sigma-70 factor (ECF subfamily)
MSPSDSTLLLKWIDRRDPEAFKELTTRYAGMVYATCTRILGNVAEAEDATQDCFERLAGMTEGPKGHLGAWLHRVATNRAIDCIRKEKRRQARQEIYGASIDATVEIDWNDVYAFVDEAIAELPERLHTPLVAHYLQGRTHNDIANELGISRQAVTRRITKAVNGIRTTLKKRGVSVAAPALAALMDANLAEAASIPASLEATLGKLAVAGLQRSTTAAAAANTAATTIGGFIVMKQIAIGAGVVAALALGSWMIVRNNDPNTQTESLPVQATENDSEAIAADTLVDSQTAADKPISDGTDGPPNRSSEDAEPEGAVIAGRVYDEDTQQGIPEVIVDARRTDQGKGGWAKTDVTGKFRITGLAEGEYDVGPPRVPGYPSFGLRRKWVKVSLSPDQVMQNVDFAIDQGIGVAGKVISTDGQPVEGAHVGAMVSGMPGAEHATSGPDGTFVVWLAEPGADLIVKVMNDEFESDMLGPLVLPPDGVDGLVLALTNPRSASIAGIALNSDGLPIADAGVHLDRGSVDYLVGSGHTETSSDGSFLIEDLVPGEYGVLLTPPGRSTFSNNDEVARITLADGQALSGLRLVLGGDKGGYAIAGRVVDTKGNPVNNVVVNAHGPVHEEGRTQEDGQFEITGLLDGAYSLNATPMGRDANGREYSPANLPNIQASTFDVEVVLHGKGTVEGRVVQADSGEPLQDFELYLCNGGANEFSSRLLLNGERVRHPEGRFSRKIYVGWVTVTAKAEGFAPAFQSVEIHEHETIGDIELHLERASDLTGLVVNSNGEPVAGARLYFGGVPHVSDREKVAAETNSEGVFTINAASPDIRELSATHPEYAPGTGLIGDHTTIVLENGSVVEGIVTQANQPLPDATVGIRYTDRQNMPWIGSTSGPDGAYRIAQLPPGEVEVTAEAEITGDRRVIAEAIVGSETVTEVNFDFAPATSAVHGHIDAAAFDPQRMDIECTVTAASGVESRRVQAKPDGTYQIANMPPGHVRLSAQISSPDALDVKQFAEFELGEDEVVEHEFIFSANSTISGRLKGSNGSLMGDVFVLSGTVQIPEPLGPEFFVELRSRRPDIMVTHTQCDADGAFAVAGIAPGTYTVLALTSPSADAQDPGRLQSATSVVEIQPDNPVLLDFDFR